MHTTSAAFQAYPDSTSTIGDADLLPRHPIFRTQDLDHAREYLGGVFVDARFSYLSQERRLDFRHRQAKLGAIAVNSMQYGPGIMVPTVRRLLPSPIHTHRWLSAPAGWQLHRYASRLRQHRQPVPVLRKGLVTGDTPAADKD